MMPIEKFLLFVALPVVVVSSLIEALLLSRRQAYNWHAMLVSLIDLFARTTINILLPLSITGPLIALAWSHRINTVELNTLTAFALLFVGQEFCYYWYHRAAHRVRWFWLNHSIHHSPNELNLSAAYRIGIFGRITGTAFFFVPLVWLGFPIRVVLATLTLNLLYQFWLHTTWIPKLGWFEYLFNTPSAHRVHHAANPEYLDANYGGVLVVFDRLFGTYIEERADLPCRYGWVDPIHSNNPLRIEFTQWARFARDLWSTRRISDLLGYVFGPPGWKPNGQGQTTEVIRERARIPI